MHFMIRKKSCSGVAFFAKFSRYIIIFLSYMWTSLYAAERERQESIIRQGEGWLK